MDSVLTVTRVVNFGCGVPSPLTNFHSPLLIAQVLCLSGFFMYFKVTITVPSPMSPPPSPTCLLGSPCAVDNSINNFRMIESQSAEFGVFFQTFIFIFFIL